MKMPRIPKDQGTCTTILFMVLRPTPDSYKSVTGIQLRPGLRRRSDLVDIGAVFYERTFSLVE